MLVEDVVHAEQPQHEAQHEQDREVGEDEEEDALHGGLLCVRVRRWISKMMSRPAWRKPRGRACLACDSPHAPDSTAPAPSR